MITAQKVREMRQDFQGGMTHGAICQKHAVTIEQEYAIVCVKSGLTDEQVVEKVKHVRPGMRSWEINSLMSARGVRI